MAREYARVAQSAMKYPALTKCFLDAVDRHANPRAQMHRGGAGWESVSAAEMLRRVAGISRALAELGIKFGDRVGIFAPNCPEWHVADFAIQALGGVTVPVYFNESQDRMCYILNDSGARIVITSGEMQTRRICESRGQLPSLEQVISARVTDDFGGDLLRYETLIGTAGDDDVAAYQRRAADVSGSDLATIIYTSGTTGEPKGVMLTHANLSSNTLDSCAGYEMQPSDVGLSLLPLAHVYERITDYSYIFRGVPVAYVEQIESAAQAIREVR
ncbi:MAG: AMP-binding protein, partial [Candidatus Acidiferrales bacterium]